MARRKESPKRCDHQLCNSIQVRHYGSFFLARRTESPNDVTTSYATASRCVSTVPLYGETDRITKWCDHQLYNSIQVHHYGSISWRIESPRAGTRYCVQYLIHQMSTASLARLGQMAPCPLHYLKREEREEKRRKFYIYPDVTHLLRNILSNCWCGMHRTCKKHPSKT